MNFKKMTVTLVAICGTFGAFAECRNKNKDCDYLPPNEKGKIYVVVKYGRGLFGQPAAETNVDIHWGEWRPHTKTVKPYLNKICQLGDSGFVMKLNHNKNDSVNLNVKINSGEIIYINQREPSQLHHKCYKKI